MRKLLLLALFAIGCAASKEQPAEIRDIEQDFPTVESLPSEELCRFESLGSCNGIIVKDTILFLNERTTANFGRCVSTNSGKEINKLVLKGNANNEMLHVDRYALFGDSLQAISGNHPKKLKLYSIHDIAASIPSTPREIYLPDTLQSFYFSLIDETRIFGSLSYIDPADDSKYFLFDGKELKYFGKIDKKLTNTNIEPDYNDLRIGVLAKKQDNKLIVASTSALHFEIIDLTTLETENKRYYNKNTITIERSDGGVSRSSMIECLSKALGCNQESIYAMYSTDKSSFVLKFDRNLNPIAKYEIPKKIRNGYFSENCDYFYGVSEDSNGETQTLTRYKL